MTPDLPNAPALTPPRHIHIVGASGSGTTTLGAALAARFGYAHLDTDEFYWEESDPPFQQARPVELRQAMLTERFEMHPAWVLSGSLAGWGDIFIPLFDVVIFLSLPNAIRMERLRARELKRYGAEALEAGGRMHQGYTDFMAWASRYDTAGLEQRSRILHEQWLERLAMPVVRIDGLLETGEQVDLLLQQFSTIAPDSNTETL